MIKFLAFLLLVGLIASLQLSSHYLVSHQILDLTSLRKAELKKHNQLRALHGCPPLKLLNSLNSAAQQYSQIQLANHEMQHSPSAKSGKYGQNLYWGWGSPTLKYIPGTASQSWYDQIQDYNYDTFTSNSGKVVGHFTAMIWKNAKSVGFGYAQGQQNDGYAIYVTANYSPTTNFVGQYQDNVPRPI